MKTLSMMVSALAGAALAATAAESKVDFVQSIQPILQKNCIKCHGPEKQKGKLRLDSKEAAAKGGKDGPAFVPGDAAKSELYRRITLPKSDDDFMPSEGDPLTQSQIDLIHDWINQGAQWPDSAIAKEGTPASAAPLAPPGPVLPPDFKPGAAEQKAIAALAQKGIEVRPIAANLNWREANLRLLGTNITDSVTVSLKEILGLVDLNLGNTKISDAGLVNLRGLTNLQRLHLELTSVSDAGLANLKGLPNLTYLNLYGTKVSDAGLEHLKGLKHLRNLYVWQTKVTDAGVKKLKTALPDLDISTGWDLSAFAKKEDKPAEAKDEKKGDKKEDKKEEKTDEKKVEKKDDKKEEKKAEKKEEKKQ